MKRDLHTTPSVDDGNRGVLPELLDEVRGLRSDLQSAVACLSTQSNGRDEMNTATQPDPAQLLTAVDLARLLCIDERTLREMRNAGDAPPSIQVVSRARWRRADVEAWIASRGAK